MDKSKYLAKAKDSFNTKKKLFLFDRAINGKEINKSEFESFSISEGLVHIYTTVYWQFEKTHKINSKTIDEIYNEIKALDSEYSTLFSELSQLYVQNFEAIFPKDDFEKLIAKEYCEYCKITKDEILILADKYQLHKKSERGWNLEIDRKKPNFEYKRDNCVMACYWCNNAKTDEFTHEEFLIIGKTIRSVWDQRLK